MDHCNAESIELSHCAHTQNFIKDHKKSATDTEIAYSSYKLKI